MKLILTIFLIMFSITPTYAQSEGTSTVMISTVKGRDLIEEIKEIYNSPNTKDIDQLGTIHNTDFILLIENNTLNMIKLTLESYISIREDEQLTPIALIKDNYYYIDKDNLTNIVNNDIKYFDNTLDSIIEGRYKYFSKNLSLIVMFLLLAVFLLLLCNDEYCGAFVFYGAFIVALIGIAFTMIRIIERYEEESIKLNTQIEKVMTNIQNNYSKEIERIIGELYEN